MVGGVLSSFALFAATLLTAPTEPGPAPGQVPSPPTSVALALESPRLWYGKTATIVDGAAISLFGTGLFLVDRSPGSVGSGLAMPLVLGGAGTFLLGGPILHLTNGHPGVAVASLNLRAIAGFTAIYLLAAHGAGACNADNGTDMPGCGKLSFPQVVGFSLPLLGAAALDDLLFARSTTPPPTSVGAALWPSVGSGSLSLAVGGRF